MWVPVVVRPGCITLLNRYTAFAYFATCSDRRMYVWWCSSLRMVNIGEFHERKESMSLTEFENLCLGHIDAAKEQLLRRSAVLCRRWWWSYRDECGLHLFMCWTAQQHLRLAASHQLTVLLHRRVTYGGRTFAVAVPSTWNSLLKCLCDPSNSASVFGHLLITFFFSEF